MRSTALKKYLAESAFMGSSCDSAARSRASDTAVSFARDRRALKMFSGSVSASEDGLLRDNMQSLWTWLSFLRESCRLDTASRTSLNRRI